MPKKNIFLDSSALIAGVISETGAAHVLLQLGESQDILLTVSDMVIVESERTIARKSPRSLDDFRRALKTSNLSIVPDPPAEDVAANLHLIRDPDDVPILLAAIRAKVDFLVTHDDRHFLRDPGVAEKSGLKIGTPGDALTWLREDL